MIKILEKTLPVQCKKFTSFFKKIINNVFRKKFFQKYCFSGGCALNSSANKFITDKNNMLENIFINFAPGDNGGALGAAFIVAANYNLNLINIKSPYLGKKFNKNEIIEILKNDKFNNKLSNKFFDSDDELFKTASKYLAEGKVIGWFQDRMEFGPRALRIDLY